MSIFINIVKGALRETEMTAFSLEVAIPFFKDYSKS